jgi:hypothetical protein
VGAMELASAMELARSLLNGILGKLYMEFIPDGSPAYWQQISESLLFSDICFSFF